MDLTPEGCPRSRQIEHSLIEAAHVGSVFDRIDRERLHASFDVVHDHCPAVALAMADRLREPFVHTLHASWPFRPTSSAGRIGGLGWAFTIGPD